MLKETQDKLESSLRSYSKHPLINVEKLLSPIQAASETQTKQLEKFRQRHPDLIENDTIRNTLTELLDGKVRPPLSSGDYQKVCKDGEDRYARSVPPGYLDARAKEGDKKYGDLVIWQEIIEQAKSSKKPVTLITDDVKDDWWWKHQGKIIGPRPELAAEMREKANVQFYMYQSDQFMKHAATYLKRPVDATAIAEVRELQEQDVEWYLNSKSFGASQSMKRLEELAKEQSLIASEIEKLELESALLTRDHVQLEALEHSTPDDADLPVIRQEILHREEAILDRTSGLKKRLVEIGGELQRGKKELNQLIHTPIEKSHVVPRALLRDRLHFKQRRTWDQTHPREPKT
jgi:hypothetical protein